jgi:hypothetical protein
MVIEEDVRGAGGQLLAIRRGLARPRYLVAAHREECRVCGGKHRIVSLWGTPKGTFERIAWCRYCFEAECGIVRPTEDEEEELDRVLRAVEQRFSVTWFDGARLAAEELERRGML